jgi:hypothetical protein
MTNNDDFAFEGFDGPNGTIVPDVFFDYLAPHLCEAELRVLLYILRRTFGFKKSADDISLSQMVYGITKRDGEVLDHGAGVQRAAASRAVKGLEQKGVISAERHCSAERGNETTTYRLRFKHPQDPQETTPSIAKRPGGSTRKRPALVSQRDPQETVSQETVKQKTDGDLSKFRKGATQIFSHDAGANDQNRPATPPVLQSASLANPSIPIRPRRAEKAARSASPRVTPSNTILADAIPLSTEPNAQPSLPAMPRPPQGFSRPADVFPAIVRGADEPRVNQGTEGLITPAEQSEDASPEYIENVIRDLSHEFSDAQHIRANVTQALHLWQQSGLSVKAFVEIVYSVRRTTRLQTDVQRRMPYCFKLLRVELGLAPNPRKNQPVKPAEQSSPPSSERPSLAGRYASFVRR